MILNTGRYDFLTPREQEHILNRKSFHTIFVFTVLSLNTYGLFVVDSNSAASSLPASGQNFSLREGAISLSETSLLRVSGLHKHHWKLLRYGCPMLKQKLLFPLTSFPRFPLSTVSKRSQLTPSTIRTHRGGYYSNEISASVWNPPHSTWECNIRVLPPSNPQYLHTIQFQLLQPQEQK